VTQTAGRTVSRAAATSAHLHQQVAQDRDFVPRMTITQTNTAAAQHMSKPKRYSTQRQRLPADVDVAEDTSYNIPNTDVAAAQSLAVGHAYYGT